MRTSHRVGVGTVVHERLAVPGTSPGRRRHEYGLYMLLVDLETVEREAVANGDEPGVGRLPSALIPGWLATTLLGAARHPTFEGENEALSRRIRKVLSVQFGAAEAARASSVFLLCVPSVLGLSFNPGQSVAGLRECERYCTRDSMIGILSCAIWSTAALHISVVDAIIYERRVRV